MLHKFFQFSKRNFCDSAFLMGKVKSNMEKNRKGRVGFKSRQAGSITRMPTSPYNSPKIVEGK